MLVITPNGLSIFAADIIGLTRDVRFIPESGQFSSARENYIEGRFALRGNHTVGGSQASENIALPRCDGLAMLQRIPLTTAYNIGRKCSASWRKFSLALFKALSQIVR
jgi:hypothetical protein